MRLQTQKALVLALAICAGCGSSESKTEPTADAAVQDAKPGLMDSVVAKMDVGPKGALVSFHDDKPPNVAGLLAYVDKLGGIAKLRPDSKLALQRNWADPAARLHGALQLSKGLAKAAG